MNAHSPHLDWCKQNALDMLTWANIQEVFRIFVADMEENPATRGHPALEKGRALLGDSIRTAVALREFINGVV